MEGLRLDCLDSKSGAFPALPRRPELSLVALSQSSSDRMFFPLPGSRFFHPSLFPLSQEEVPLAFDRLAIFSVFLDHIPAKVFSHWRIDCD